MTCLIAFVVASIALSACKTEAPASTVSIASPPQPTESASAVKGTLLPPSTNGADDACVTDSDCTWGDIPHEITQSTDCMCLFGCPSFAQNKIVEARRTSQHTRLCTPGMDNHGDRCPIDDCASPPPIHCVTGKCGGSRGGAR